MIPALRPGSLASKLLLLSATLVLLPAGLFAWIAFGTTRAALERVVGRQLTEVAQDAAERIDVEIAVLQASLNSWARSADWREIALDVPERGARALRSLRSVNGSQGPLLLADAAGRVVAATAGTLVGADLSGRPWWKEASRGVAKVATHRRDVGSPEVEMVAPIASRTAAGEIVGALVLASSVESLNGPLQHLQHDLAMLGLDADVLLVDDSGQVISGGWWKEPSSLLGENLRAAGWRALDPSAITTRPRFLRDDALGVLVGVAPVTGSGLGWMALAVQPLDEAFAPAFALRRQLLLALVIVLLAGLVLAGWIAARISRPIRELTAATHELARRGEIPRRVEVQSQDEIGELAGAFNSMASDLMRAREDLIRAAKLAFVGELAAGMAHEIRTPLGIVRSSAQILERTLAPQQTQQTHELIQMIVEEVDRLDRVVSGLLELARPRAPIFESVALASVLARALDFIAPQAAERGVVVRRDLEAPLPPAFCDPDQIYQVALNLVVNALQVLPRGGTVSVRTFAAADTVGFEVRDDGPGMSDDVRERIFAPFFTRRPGGTGLGLALVQRILEAHHGSIDVMSMPGQGATFRVELPTRGVAPEAEMRA